MKTKKGEYTYKLTDKFKKTKENDKIKANLLKYIKNNDFDNRALTMLLDVAKTFTYAKGNIVEDYELEREIELDNGKKVHTNRIVKDFNKKKKKNN